MSISIQSLLSAAEDVQTDDLQIGTPLEPTDFAAAAASRMRFDLTLYSPVMPNTDLGQAEYATETVSGSYNNNKGIALTPRVRPSYVSRVTADTIVYEAAPSTRRLPYDPKNAATVLQRELLRNSILLSTDPVNTLLAYMGHLRDFASSADLADGISRTLLGRRTPVRDTYLLLHDSLPDDVDNTSVVEIITKAVSDAAEEYVAKLDVNNKLDGLQRILTGIFSDAMCAANKVVPGEDIKDAHVCFTYGNKLVTKGANSPQDDVITWTHPASFPSLDAWVADKTLSTIFDRMRSTVSSAPAIRDAMQDTLYAIAASVSESIQVVRDTHEYYILTVGWERFRHRSEAQHLSVARNRLGKLPIPINFLMWNVNTPTYANEEEFSRVLKRLETLADVGADREESYYKVFTLSSFAATRLNVTVVTGASPTTSRRPKCVMTILDTPWASTAEQRTARAVRVRNIPMRTKGYRLTEITHEQSLDGELNRMGVASSIPPSSTLADLMKVRGEVCLDIVMARASLNSEVSTSVDDNDYAQALDSMHSLEGFHKLPIDIATVALAAHMGVEVYLTAQPDADGLVDRRSTELSLTYKVALTPSRRAMLPLRLDLDFKDFTDVWYDSVIPAMIVTIDRAYASTWRSPFMAAKQRLITLSQVKLVDDNFRLSNILVGPSVYRHLGNVQVEWPYVRSSVYAITGMGQSIKRDIVWPNTPSNVDLIVGTPDMSMEVRLTRDTGSQLAMARYLLLTALAKQTPIANDWTYTIDFSCPSVALPLAMRNGRVILAGTARDQQVEAMLKLLPHWAEWATPDLQKIVPLIESAVIRKNGMTRAAADNSIVEVWSPTRKGTIPLNLADVSTLFQTVSSVWQHLHSLGSGNGPQLTYMEVPQVDRLTWLAYGASTSLVTNVANQIAVNLLNTVVRLNT